MRASAVFALALPLLQAAATALPRDDLHAATLNAANLRAQSSITNLAIVSSALGIVLPNISGLLGLSCSPLTLSVVGAGGNNCSSQPVYCTNNSFNGLIVLGCSPINVNL